MRSLWSGCISFGLVNIPIVVQSMTREGGVPFELLHKKDLAPIRNARICTLEEHEVPYDQIVRGVRDAGSHVVVHAQELEDVYPRATKTIEIQYFVDEQSIDPIYFQRPYYLEPKMLKPYRLLVRALEKTKKVGIVSFVIRHHGHLGCIRSRDGFLFLHQLRYIDDIEEPERLRVSRADAPTTREIDIATSLVDQLSTNFRPSNERDQFREKVEALLQEKRRRRRSVLPLEQPVEPTDIRELAAQLQASLASPNRRSKK